MQQSGSEKNGAMSKPNFSIRTVFWIMLVVAAFLGGRASMAPTIDRHVDEIKTQQAISADLQRALEQINQYEQAFKKQTQVGSERARAGNENEN